MAYHFSEWKIEIMKKTLARHKWLLKCTINEMIDTSTEIIMKQSIYQINDKNGNKLGLLKTPDFLDILDVTLRAKNMYGDDSDWANPVYLGDI